MAKLTAKLKVVLKAEMKDVLLAGTKVFSKDLGLADPLAPQLAAVMAVTKAAKMVAQ